MILQVIYVFFWSLLTESLACDSWRMYGLIVSEDLRRNHHSWVSQNPTAAVAVWEHCLLSGSYLLSNSAPSASLLRGESFLKLNYVAHARPYKVMQTQMAKLFAR